MAGIRDSLEILEAVFNENSHLRVIQPDVVGVWAQRVADRFSETEVFSLASKHVGYLSDTEGSKTRCRKAN